MSENRHVQVFTFSGSGTETITVAADEHIEFFQIGASVDADTTIQCKIGSETMFLYNIGASTVPIQLFYYDFGNGRGTGVLGDNLTITLGDAGFVDIAYKIFKAE